ncbi:MAG: hypothetical protein LBL01_03800 [Bifidobacteriaceae bacterium]|nr:hypothetical protein [Bifidobacteriaceae bacterium]
MASYTYKCRNCGKFDLGAAMGAAPRTAVCPVCGASGRRVLTAPRIGISRGDPRLRAIEQTMASAHEPPVVDAVPGGARAGRRAPADPRQALLPRP